MMRVGRQFGGLAAIALGAFVLLWDDFATPWENVPVAPPLRGGLAYLVGAILIVAGAAMLWQRSAKWAALVLAAICAGFTLLWVLVVAHAPLVYDSWGNVAEESSVAAGFLALFASVAPLKTDNMARLALGARVWFGICSLSFGVVHFVSLTGCTAFVPKWMPLGGLFWAVFTGVAHLAVAVALLSGILGALGNTPCGRHVSRIRYIGLGHFSPGKIGSLHVGRRDHHLHAGRRRLDGRRFHRRLSPEGRRTFSSSPALGPVYIVVTAATLPILPVSGRVRSNRVRTRVARCGTSGKRGQNRRVPKGFGENHRLVRRSPRPYCPIRSSGGRGCRRSICHPAFSLETRLARTM